MRVCLSSWNLPSTRRQVSEGADAAPPPGEDPRHGGDQEPSPPGDWADGDGGGGNDGMDNEPLLQFCLDQQDTEQTAGLPVLVFDCHGDKGNQYWWATCTLDRDNMGQDA